MPSLVMSSSPSRRSSHRFLLHPAASLCSCYVVFKCCSPMPPPSGVSSFSSPCSSSPADLPPKISSPAGFSALFCASLSSNLADEVDPPFWQIPAASPPILHSPDLGSSSSPLSRPHPAGGIPPSPALTPPAATPHLPPPLPAPPLLLLRPTLPLRQPTPWPPCSLCWQPPLLICTLLTSTAMVASAGCPTTSLVGHGLFPSPPAALGSSLPLLPPAARPFPVSPPLLQSSPSVRPFLSPTPVGLNSSLFPLSCSSLSPVLPKPTTSPILSATPYFLSPNRMRLVFPTHASPSP